jgi:redox-sensitive bicupin YhaK (pirin superfamily)
MEGFIDHSDSLKKIGRYGPGDCQFMTSGRGIQHAEMFPLINKDSPNTLRLFQIWLNIPKVNKNCPPTQITHWAEDVPKIIQDGCIVTVWAGELAGKIAQSPPPHSYANDPTNKVGIFFIKLDPGSQFTLPARLQDNQDEKKKINRTLYFVSGEKAIVNKSSPFPTSTTLVCDSAFDFTIENPASADTVLECLVLEGRPIGEPVAQRGPFVMNTQDELANAFLEYRMTQFGQPWPFSSHAPVHGRDRGRFADLGDGKILYPPSR